MTETPTPRFVRTSGDVLMMWCPGCDDLHRITVNGPNAWTWDGDREMPTVSPSILVTGKQWAPECSFYRPNHKVATGEVTRCHSFLRAGRWEFLGDCTHTLAGQTVPMVPLPEHFDYEDAS